MIISNNS